MYKHNSILILTLLIFIFCTRDKKTIDNSQVTLEEDTFLLEIKGTVVGSTGHYTLLINRNTSILYFYFNDDQIIISDSTSFEIANSLQLGNEFLTFEASLDEDGNPTTRVEIPSHNREVAATAVISNIGEGNTQSNSFIPQIDPSMAIFNGTIEGKLSIDNGNNYSDQIVESSNYNVTINNGQINGLLKCNTCPDDSIYNVNGFLSENNDTHVIFNIQSITNRSTGQEILSTPKLEQYIKHTGGLLLEREEFQTVGLDSIIKKTSYLKYVN